MEPNDDEICMCKQHRRDLNVGYGMTDYSIGDVEHLTVLTRDDLVLCKLTKVSLQTSFPCEIRV